MSVTKIRYTLIRDLPKVFVVFSRLTPFKLYPMTFITPVPTPLKWVEFKTVETVDTVFYRPLINSIVTGSSSYKQLVSFEWKIFFITVMSPKRNRV